MKQCPNCKTTYTDDSLQFCLSDGTTLILVPNEPETVRMPFGDSEAMRVNILQNSVPTVFGQSPVAQNQPTKKIFGLIIAGIIGIFLLLAIVGVAGFLYYKQTGEKDGIVAASPTPTSKPTVSPTVSPNDETEKLKNDLANLQKQLQDQKNQKSNLPNIPPANQKGTTARANSPTDGFLALRSEPSSDTGYRIAKIPHGATLTVLDCPKPSNVGKMAGHWCQVIYNGQSGWAFDAFMSF